MQQLEAALRRLAQRAEPLPTEVVIARIETELGLSGEPGAVAEREEPIMVTHQQPDLETPTPTPPPRRSRRGPLLAAAVAAVVIFAAVGLAFAAGAFDSESDTAADRLAVATDLVDTWGQGWEARDLELVVSVFTDDGVYIDEGLAVPMENMEYFLLGSARVTGLERGSDLTPSGDSSYTWVQEFDFSVGRYEGDMEIELEGDLAKRIEWIGEGYRPIGPASDS